MSIHMTVRRVRVRKEKWPLAGSNLDPRPVSTWTARVLGTDQFGTWLFCAEGETHQKADGTPVVVPSDGVQLLPSSGWWVGWWWRRDHWIGVDICTPPSLDASGCSYIDLDLDLARLADGRVVLVDEDEFEQARIDCALPPGVVAAARSAASELQVRLAGEDEPVVAAGWAWLDNV